MGTVKERLKSFLKTIPNAKGKLGISEGEFERKTGLSNSAVSNIGKSISVETLEKIIKIYPRLSKIWLLHGLGEMLTPEHFLYEPTSIPLDEVSQQNIPLNMDENKKSLYDLIQSNKELVATNLKLTSMLEKVMANTTTEYDRKEIDQVEHAMLQAIREVVIEMGVGKLWPSTDKGDLKLGKLTSGYMKTKKEVGIQNDSGK